MNGLRIWSLKCYKNEDDKERSDNCLIRKGVGKCVCVSVCVVCVICRQCIIAFLDTSSLAMHPSTCSCLSHSITDFSPFQFLTSFNLFCNPILQNESRPIKGNSGNGEKDKQDRYWRW